MNKYKIAVFIVIILIIVVIIGVLFSITINNKREEKSIELSKKIVGLYQGEDFKTTAIEGITDEAATDIEEFKQYLKEKDNNYYVLLTEEEYVADLEQSENIVAPPDIGDELIEEDNELIVEEEIEDSEDCIIDTNTLKLSEITTSDKVYVENGEVRVKVNDLDFNTEGFATLDMYGGDYKVYLEQVDKTYEMIKNDTNYIFIFLKTDKEKGDIVVYYKSMKTNKLLRLIFEYKGTTVKSVKIEAPNI